VRVTVTGATGLIGQSVVGELRARGDEVTVLSRDPERARSSLGATGSTPLDAVAWDPLAEAAPVDALAGRDAVVNLAGENVAQRWTARAKEAIRDSRVTGTGNLIEGIRQADPRPRVLVSSSAVGYYGAHGEEPIDEEAPPGSDFLARVCVAWEGAAERASDLGVRVVCIRTGVVLHRDGGALRTMLPAFRAGVGGPVAGGRQYMAWIHRDDVMGLVVAALDGEAWRGPINATAPEPVTNTEFSRALGRVLHRPTFMPVPALALRLRYGEMAEIVTTGVRALPARALVLGYQFRYPHLEQALAAALAEATR
jgi:uncharacterized protein